jgi:hypothetical protein
MISRSEDHCEPSRSCSSRTSCSIRQFRPATSLAAALNATLGDKERFTGSLPPILDDLRNARNPAVHSGRTDRKAATLWHNRMLGIGTEGIFVRLGSMAGR